MNLGLSDRTALVCGASKGLGLACAEALIAEGANVVMLARHEQRLEREATRLGATPVAADMTDPAGLEGGEPPASEIAAIPLGRFGIPRELGDLAAFLCSGRASYLTGITVPVDGSQSRGLT